MTGPRQFRSRIGGDFARYLALKRALGRKFEAEEKLLRNLDGFLASRFPSARELSVAILETWMARSPILPQTRAARLRVVRQFCLYCRRMAPKAFVPDRIRHRWLWPQHVTRCVPTILSKAQVRDLLRAALALPDRRRPRMFFTLLLLLYTAGLRLSEVVRLRVGDIDFTAGTLLIRETKFFKTRLVPLAADVLQQLQRHVRALRLPRMSASLDQPLFQHDGRPYSIAHVAGAGRQLLRASGLKPARGRVGPHLHCLRHSFAVHRIANWYAAGVDVQARLPSLATYMGHTGIASTQYYVTVTAEILQHAARRFERTCAPHEGR